MINFECVDPQIKISAIQQELLHHHAAWLSDGFLQKNFDVFADANSIVLRWWQPDAPQPTARPHAVYFPETLQLLELLSFRLGGELGIVFFSKLDPGKKVHRHVDSGHNFHLWQRFHLVIQSSHGSVLLCGDEEVRMKEGELWWFDNTKPHEALNKAREPRVHLVFDILTDPVS